MHVIAAKAIAFKEAQSSEFKADQQRVVDNAKVMAAAIEERGYRIVSGGTDNHLMLVDIGVKGLTGKDATLWLDQAQITVNKNLIPYDTKSPMMTSGIRLGTPAVTTRGMGTPEMKKIANLICEVLDSKGDDQVMGRVTKEVDSLVEQYPLYPELNGVTQGVKP